jgi:D-serine deaminase-like pyridoxal phosphate-dependent protein
MERIVAALGAGSNGRLQLAGLLSHFGHTYAAGSPGKIVEIFNKDVGRLDATKRYLARLGHDVAISVGDTPSCSLVETFAGVDEIRPGNFVFYDLSQLSYGVCQEEEIAVALACPVVAKHPARGQIVIHGGAVHLSLDRLSWKGRDPLFGAVTLARNGGWSRIFDDSYLRKLSQEHGIVQAEIDLFDQVDVGDLLLVIPVHSCLTADLMGHFLTLTGKPVEMMPRRSLAYQPLPSRDEEWHQR